MNAPSRDLVEKYITKLKSDGISKISSIVQVASHFKIGLDAAKSFVHESSAWREQRKSHEEFQQTLIDGLDDDQLSSRHDEE